MGCQIHCETLATEVSTIGTSNALIIYGSFGGFSALYVCRRINGKECNVLALAVASGFMSVFALLDQTGALRISSRDEGNHTMPMHEFFQMNFEDHGIEYKAITDSTEELLPLYGEDQRKPLSVTSLHGVKHLNDTPVNMDIYDFGNGEGHIHLPHDMLIVLVFMI